MLKGKIIKSISGFYEVHTGDNIYRCRARGALRKKNDDNKDADNKSDDKKPLVGDDVLIQVTDTVSVPMEGKVIDILPRKNKLVRPKVANVDQALLLFAVTYPSPSYNMLDRFLITTMQRNLPTILCFNKQDLARNEEIRELRETYEACGCKVFFVSVLEPETLNDLRKALAGKTTVLTGPSGVGKSTLINTICPGANLQTGELSRKIRRGKNTTRYVEILAGENGTYLIDTPGFTSLEMNDLKPEDLRHLYPEFQEYEGKCRFDSCVHIKEPDCAVRQAVDRGKISRIRYENYKELFRNLKNKKPDYGHRKKDKQTK